MVRLGHALIEINFGCSFYNTCTELYFSGLLWRWGGRNQFTTLLTCLVLMWQKSALWQKVGVQFLLQSRYFFSRSLSHVSSRVWENEQSLLLLIFWEFVVQRVMEKSVKHCVNRIWFLQIQEALHRATSDSNSQVGGIFRVLHTKESPPTYFQLNKYTSSFQAIVDAYGWA